MLAEEMASFPVIWSAYVLREGKTVGGCFLACAIMRWRSFMEKGIDLESMKSQPVLYPAYWFM
jgi:hypothetical protein